MRDSKVAAKVDGNDALDQLEQFLPQQPLEVHADAQAPTAAINIQASPWDETPPADLQDYVGPADEEAARR